MPLPNLQRFLELPISVRYSYDAYPAIDAVLQELRTQGGFYQAAQLADAIYTDDRIIGVLSTRVNSVFSLPMEFKYQGQEDGDAESDDPLTLLKAEIAELAEKNYERMLPSSALKEISRSGLLLNAGIGELKWAWSEADDDLWIPTLKTWNSQALWWRQDRLSYWLNTQDGPIELHPGDGRWVMFSPLGNNHSWLFGLLSALGKLWMDRLFAFRDWSRSAEKFALGIMKAFAPADAGDDDKKRFMAAMRNPAAESTILLPITEAGNKFDLEMLSTDAASTSWETYKERIKQLDESIAVAVLGQNLTTSIDHGSRAAAQVHENIRQDVLKSDVEVLASMIKTQVYGPWVQDNWGDQAEALGVNWRDLVPDITWIVDPPEDKAKTSAAIYSIAQSIPLLAGTDADIRALLEKHDIPVLEQRAEPLDPPPTGDLQDRPGDAQTLNHRTSAAIPKGLGHGARRGQVFVDDVADVAREQAKVALAANRNALLEICKSSSNYDEVRARVKTLYQHTATPVQLRGIVEKALVTAQLVGRLSSREDTRVA